MLTSSSSEDVLSRNHHKSSSKDYSWNSSNGIRFASGQKQGKDLTWRSDYGIIFKDDTDNYLRNLSHRKAPNSNRILYTQSSGNERNPFQSAICSCKVATVLNRKRETVSLKTEAKYELSAYGSPTPHMYVNRVPRPKKVRRTQLEEPSDSQAHIKEQLDMQIKEWCGLGPDSEMENGPQIESFIPPNAYLKDKDGIYDDYVKMRKAALGLNNAYYECTRLTASIVKCQGLRLQALRVSDENWEKLFNRVDSNISLLKDLQRMLIMAERFLRAIDIHLSYQSQIAVISTSLSHILLDFSEMCLEMRGLLWQLKRKRRVHSTFHKLLRIYTLLKSNFQDVRHRAHNTRRAFYNTGALTFAQRVMIVNNSLKHNLKELLESLESMETLRPHKFVNNSKPSEEELNFKFTAANKKESFRKLEYIYLKLKTDFKIFCWFHLRSWSNRLQQLWLQRNGSIEEAFLDWHISPFRKMLRTFEVTRKMIWAYHLSAVREHNLNMLVTTRKAEHLKNSLASLCKAVREMGSINHLYTRPIYQIFLLALTRNAQEKTKPMLQSRLEALKLAKQRRLLISGREIDAGRSTSSMHSLLRSSKIKIRRVQTSVGSKHNAESIIDVPPKIKNIRHIKNSLSTKNDVESVIKLPPTMMLNLNSNLQMRSMHTSCIDQFGDDTAAGSKVSHRNHNPRGALTGRAAQLEYQIPTSVLQSGMRASPQTPAAYWSYDLYRSSSNDRVKLHYCVTKKSVEAVCKYFLNQPVLGFDMEWDVQGRSGFKNKVSLIQLASEDRIALFHISLFEDEDVRADSLPTLKAIMESRNVIKAGVSIKGDCTRLRKNIGIDACGLIELSHLHNLVKYSTTHPEKVSKRAVALAVQVEEHLQLPLHKGDVRESDWTQRLSAEQMIYAASDAYAGYQLYYVLEGKRLKLHPVPPRPAYADLGLPIKLADKIDKNDCETPDEGSSVINERISPTDELTYPVPLMISNATETHGDSASSTYSSNILKNGSSANINVHDSRHETSSKGKARFSDYPEIQEAEAWVENWRAARSPSVALRTSAANLRAYALWHAQSLELCRIASILRDPPLQLSTVSCYILDCVQTEKLPFDESRIQGVINLIPRFLVYGKYKYFLQRARLTGSDVR